MSFRCSLDLPRTALGSFWFGLKEHASVPSSFASGSASVREVSHEDAKKCECMSVFFLVGFIMEKQEKPLNRSS